VNASSTVIAGQVRSVVAGVRVWDAPTRLVHWLLVALVSFSWWSAAHHRMEYHRYSGSALLGVLAFRIYWGFCGSSTARFSQFVKGPRSIWSYLRSRAPHSSPGHNPLGALSVILLLTLLLAQVALGLFSVDIDGIESGPLSHFVSFEAGRACARLHRCGFDVLRYFVVLHVAAVAFYALFKRENLVKPMFTGWKTWSQQPPPRVKFAPPWYALIGVALAAGLVWWIA
jgi:cytochrome b